MAMIDWVVVGAYMVIILIVGALFTSKAGASDEDYFIAGRKLTWWLLGTSMVATAFASDTPLFITKLVRQYGISGAWYYWNASINGIVAAFMIAFLWRRTRLVTDAEFRELRYSGASGQAARAGWALYRSLTNAFFVLAWVILAMIKICKTVFELDDTIPILGMDVDSSVAIVAISLAVTLAYSVLSGLWGVVVTDFIQFIIAFLGAFLLAFMAIRDVGGIEAFHAQIAALPSEVGGAHLLNVYPAIKTGLIVFWVGMLVQWWSSAWADGGIEMAQRSMAARNEKHSQIGRFWGHLAQMGIIAWPWAIVALCSLIIFPSATTPVVADDPEMAYPMMVLHSLPIGLRGVMVAGLFAAFMSSVDTLLNLTAAYSVNDIYKRFLVRDASPRHYVLIGRIASIIALCIGGYMAVISDSILTLSQLLAEFTAGVGAVFLLRWFWWRINAWSEISAYIASAFFGSLLEVKPVTAWLHQTLLALTPSGANPAIDHFFNVLMPSDEGWAFRIVAIAILTTVVAIIVTFLTPPTEKEHLHAFYRRVKPYGPGWAKVRREAGPVELASGQLRFDWVLMLVGAVFFYSVFLAVGKLMLGYWVFGGVAATLAVISGAALYGKWRAMPDEEDLG